MNGTSYVYSSWESFDDDDAETTMIIAMIIKKERNESKTYKEKKTFFFSFSWTYSFIFPQYIYYTHKKNMFK